MASTDTATVHPAVGTDAAADGVPDVDPLLPSSALPRIAYVPDAALPHPIWQAVGFIERFGWPLLFTVVVLYYYYCQWRAKRARDYVYGAERVARLDERRRDVRASQQSAWNAERAAFYSAERMAERERVRAKLYGAANAPAVATANASASSTATPSASAAAPAPSSGAATDSASAAAASAPTHVQATMEDLGLSAPVKPKRHRLPAYVTDSELPLPSANASGGAAGGAADAKPKPKKKFDAGGSAPSGGFRPYFGQSDGGGGCGTGRSRFGGGRRGGG